MRKRAPLMFAAGLAMVLLQILSVYGLVSGMVHPSCNSNTQCGRAGFFCYVEPGQDRGKCQMCGEMPPLVPYRSATERLTAEQVENDNTNEYKDSPLGMYKEYNLVWDMSYPQQAGGGRSKTPEWFAGWNYTMVQDTCSVPIRPFNWEFTKSSSGAYTITDVGDIPDGVPLDRIFPTTDLVYTHFDAPCVARWCDACVEHDALDHGDGLSFLDQDTKLTVSIMNKKLLAETSVKSMGPFVRVSQCLCCPLFCQLARSLTNTPIDPMSYVDGDHWQDWVALILCSYVIGMQMAGEIKDTALCEIAMDRNIKELPVFWQYALGFLNRLRSQFFLQPLVGAIPCVVLTQGGSALDICFNTVAVSGTAHSHLLPLSCWNSDLDNDVTIRTFADYVHHRGGQHVIHFRLGREVERACRYFRPRPPWRRRGAATLAHQGAVRRGGGGWHAVLRQQRRHLRHADGRGGDGPGLQALGARDQLQAFVARPDRALRRRLARLVHRFYGPADGSHRRHLVCLALNLVRLM